MSDQQSDDFFGKAPIGGSPVPVAPGFGMTGRTIDAHPGNQSGRGPAGPNNGRRNGSRARAAMPPGLTAGANELDRREQPPNFIGDVDIDRNWFSPFQPVWPFGPPFVDSPREWDYPVGVNLDYMPRRFQTYQMLRTIAQSWGVLSTVIEARIDELVALPWEFQLKDDKKDSATDPRIKQLEAFFKKPDRKRPYPIWMRMIFRDRYIIDAASTYINRSMTGAPYAIEVLDGATIKPLVDDAGRMPDYPYPAFQQIIKGLPMNNFTEREILYMPNRPRSEMPIYGYSEVEQIMLEATEGIRKTLYQLNFWQEGTIPDVMLGVPETWTPEQIAMWQASFDALLSGNADLKSKIRFIPGGMKPFEMKGSAGELLKCDYDEWITRIICFAFRMLPKPFVKEPESRAAAEQAQDAIIEQGLQVEMVWWKCYMDSLLEMGWGWDDIEFNFSVNEETDPKVQSEVLTTYVKVGVMNVDEARSQLGMEPIAGGNVAMIYTSQGAVLLEDMANGQLAEQAAEASKQKQQALSKPVPKGGATTKRLDPLALARLTRY